MTLENLLRIASPRSQYKILLYASFARWSRCGIQRSSIEAAELAALQAARTAAAAAETEAMLR